MKTPVSSLRRFVSAVGVLTLLGAARPVWADGLEVDLEGGVAAASANVVRIPGDGGTRLSLVDDLSTKAAPAFRVRAGYRFAERHLVTALYAPLTVLARGTLDRDVSFEGRTFAAGSTALAVYRFDSYRLTYRYDLLRRDELELGVGLTGKIRDAEVSLYGGEARRKTNTGFVPLVNLHLAWRPGGGVLGLLLDADALAAPQGRAEDILLAGTWAVHEGVTVRAGYRTVEGGSNVDEVYSFTWLHYGVLGVELRFP